MFTVVSHRPTIQHRHVQPQRRSLVAERTAVLVVGCTLADQPGTEFRVAGGAGSDTDSGIGDRGLDARS